MANLTGSDRSRYVQSMFARIASRYDLMNRIMTAGQDVRWRRQVIRMAELHTGQRLLDLGAGTGDLVFEALRQSPGVRLIAADFTIEMIRQGRQRAPRPSIPWAAADALCLPFSAGSFDSVVSGFLLRNVPDVRLALQEIYRVLKPSGRFINLDTTRPPEGPLSPFIRLYLRRVIPALGRWIAGQAAAYQYLPASTEGFLSAADLADLFSQAGFLQVTSQLRMFGTVAIHSAVK